MNKQGDTIAIENAVIGFEHASQNSDAGGESLFTHLEGDFSFQIEAVGYDSYSGNVQVRDDTVIHVYLGLPDLDVTFRVMNFYTGRGVSNTRVVMNGLEKWTDSQGIVSFTEKKGAFDLIVEHPTYENWPNPAGEVLHLELPGQGPFHVTLTNVSGQLIYDDTMAGNQYDFNIQSFKKGIYFLTIRSANNVIARRIIKI